MKYKVDDYIIFDEGMVEELLDICEWDSSEHRKIVGKIAKIVDYVNFYYYVVLVITPPYDGVMISIGETDIFGASDASSRKG